MNRFISHNTQKDTLTENGALSNSTTGNVLADQFGKAGAYRGRSIPEVWADQQALWSFCQLWSLRFVIYLRMITRTVQFFTLFKTNSVQRGQGNKDESIKRFLWFAEYKFDLFEQYMPLFVAVGSFRDLVQMYYMVATSDQQFSDPKHILDAIIKLFVRSILAEENMALKYMPVPQASSKCTTAYTVIKNHMAKMLAKELAISYRDMRIVKAGGRGHTWQQLISKRKYDQIDFSLIPGRALFLMGTSKFLTNQKLTESYTRWLENKPIAKFTGYVYELANKIDPSNSITTRTIDKQFQSLIELAKTNNNKKWIVALDTSGSMICSTSVKNVTAMTVARSLAVYFANLLDGAFKHTFISFDTTSKLHQLKDNGFTNQYTNIIGGMGSTNFQSVIDLIVNTRKNSNIPLEEYPTGVIVVSDMQFNPAQEYRSAGYGGYRGSFENWLPVAKTNHEAAMAKLSQVFPKEWVDDFKIVWWDCTARCSDFPSVNTDSGTVVVSGFDGAIIANLFGKEYSEKEKPTMEDTIKEVLSQEIFERIFNE